MKVFIPWRKLKVLSLMSLLLLSLTAFAVDPAGKVIKVDGVVVAVSGSGETRILKRGDNLFPKEVVKTDSTSSIVMRYMDGTIVQLQKASDYVVNEFSYAENAPEKDNYSAELLKGGFRSITGKIGSRSPQNFETRARQTTLTVRGTQFEGVLPPCPGQVNSQTVVCDACLWHVTVGSVVVDFKGAVTPLTAGTDSAGYILDNSGNVTLTKTAPAGTGSAPYGNEPLQPYVQASTTDTTETTTSGTASGATAGGGGGGGGDPCSDLQTIKTQIAK